MMDFMPYVFWAIGLGCLALVLLAFVGMFIAEGERQDANAYLAGKLKEQRRAEKGG